MRRLSLRFLRKQLVQVLLISCQTYSLVFFERNDTLKGDSRKMKTRKLAFSAMMSALGVVILYMGAIVEVLDLTTVALASVFVFFAVIELGSPYQYLIYAVTSVLSVLLLPDKFSAASYLLFGGIYPIFKSMFEKIGGAVCRILKFVYFNVVISVLMAVSVYILHLDGYNKMYRLSLYLLGNFAFLMYDILMSNLIRIYIFKLRGRFRIGRYFNEKS